MRLRRWAVLLLLIAVPVAGALGRESGDRIALGEVDQPVRLLVQLQSPPLAEDSGAENAVRIAAEHMALRSRLAQAGIDYRELSEHRQLFNGLALQVRPEQAGRVAGLRGVAGVYLSRKTQIPEPQLFSSVKMIGAQKAWAGDPDRAIPGVDGSGITVAIIDTGIDYSHPDLGGCFGPGCRVVAGMDLVGDSFSGENDPVPDDDPMDMNGHGTHVAGIIGARAAGPDGVTGVAPGVSLVSLKIFGPSGYTWDDLIIKALETAYEMRVDVVNMSIGAPFQWPQYPTAQAVKRLADRGVVVATSAGNSGAAGEFATGAPAAGAGTLAVASFENDAVRRKAFRDPAGTLIPYDVMVESPPPPESGQSDELVHVGLGARDSDFLGPDGKSRVQGKVALIQRGEVAFLEKSERARKHGATAAIIYNNQPGFFMGTLQLKGTYIPTISITRDDGLKLRAAMDRGPVRVAWEKGMHLFPSFTAGMLSDFSSWGPTPDLAVKPDLTAPGGSIYSTYLTSEGGYATLSGTSMASPHVAGAAALVLQARQEMNGAGGSLVKSSTVRTLLMNTAQPRTEGPQSDQLYPVHRQGAGLIDVWRAITAEQRVLPEKIALGTVRGGDRVDQTIVIENLGTRAETYRLQVVGAGGPGVGLSDAGSGVGSGAAGPSIAVRGGRTGRLSVTLSIPTALADQAIFSGWIAVVNGAGERVAHIPYLGYKGDYQAATTLDPLFFGFPWLARREGLYLHKSSAIEIHPDCECDSAYAWIIFSLARQPQELRLEIWDPQTGRKWGEAFREPYLGRSAGSFEIFIWDASHYT